MPETTEDQLVDAIAVTVPALLNTMEAFEILQREMHPPRFTELNELIKPFPQHLSPLLDQLRGLGVTGYSATVREMLCKSAHYALQACENFSAGSLTADSDSERGMGLVMRALRSYTRAQESLYPLANIMSPINRFFLEPAVRSDETLLTSLTDLPEAGQRGILSASNQRHERGGFTLYIPENYQPEEALPLVVALHGGSGHGSDFLWNWLREARSRKFLLLAATSIQPTWSLMGPDQDSLPLRRMVDYVQQNWSVDASHVLLTGLSDGATFTLLSGLAPESPFTHLAALSGVMPPDNFINGNLLRASGKPIYLAHGTLDWMFPIERAYAARDDLLNAGAEVVFQAIEGLSHTYARGENDAILNWFKPSLALPNN